MMDNPDMQAVMTIFAEKILTNLWHSKHDQEDSKRLIDVSLDVFSFYCNSISTQRMLSNTQVVSQLIEQGDISILSHPSQLKQLGNFYKILINLWLNDDYISVFDKNIQQLHPLIV